jgi:hypothetical protein
MTAELTLEMGDNSCMQVGLNNALLEEFNDGFNLHADNNISIAIYNTDCKSQKHSDDNDEFILNNGTKVSIEWD